MAHKTPQRETPEPLADTCRWLPPVLPPAPPGGGMGGPPSDGPFRRRGDRDEPDEQGLVAALLPLLADLAVPQATFATLDCFPDDPEIQTELMSAVEDARANLVRQLDSLLANVATEQPPFTHDALRRLQTSLLSSVRPFGPFSLTISPKREVLRALPPREFALLVLDHFKTAVQDDAHYQDRAVFGAAVHNDFRALWFAAYLASTGR